MLPDLRGVVGPPPVDEAGHNERTASLDAGVAQVCGDSGVPHVAVLADLVASPVWMPHVAEGDGAHPGAAGYATLAGLVWPQWRAWVRGLADPRQEPGGARREPASGGGRGVPSAAAVSGVGVGGQEQRDVVVLAGL